MSLEGMLREEFMAGHREGMKHGVALAEEVLKALFAANNQQPLPLGVIEIAFQTCRDQMGP